jgi:hypothetical protein
MKKYILILALFSTVSSHAQVDKSSNNSVSIGIELDALPYITGGYYGSLWIGRNHMRYRAVLANVNTPDIMVEDGFTNNEIQAYAAIVDYFFKPNFERWWIGAGIEYWDGSIQTDAALETATYSQTVFTLGGGYVWKFHKNFYLNPWVAFHARLAGDREVSVNEKVFEPATFTPEASLKVGWYFGKK